MPFQIWRTEGLPSGWNRNVFFSASQEGKDNSLKGGTSADPAGWSLWFPRRKTESHLGEWLVSKYRRMETKL